MTHFDPLIEAIKQQMQPEGRAQHLVEMLQPLFAVTPDNVTLADLMVGWQFLGRPQSPDETAAIAHRREICAKLAAIAASLTRDPGNLTQAVKTWHVWQDAFQQSSDPRHAAMAKILTREMTELQALQG